MTTALVVVTANAGPLWAREVISNAQTALVCSRSPVNSHTELSINTNPDLNLPPSCPDETTPRLASEHC